MCVISKIGSFSPDSEVAHARVTPAKFLGFFFWRDWLSCYLWLDTLAGGNERICVSERGKLTIAQRSTRVDRGEGSSEFWALCLSQSDSRTLNFTGLRAGFSEALSEPIG